MRIIFLDVDGVLNCLSTKETYKGFIGIDPRLVEKLAVLYKQSSAEEETNIVISSSWRIGQDRNGCEMPGSYAYLTRMLEAEGMSIFDDTPRLKVGVKGRSRRGREIAEWFYRNRNLDITGFVVLDDEFFDDFKKYGISAHLVRTSYAPGNGGFQKKHVKQAMRILRNIGIDESHKFTSIAENAQGDK